MSIENTRNRDPLLNLLGAMSEGTSEYITGMESAGQQQVVNSDLLPTEAPWERLEELGFTRGEVVEGDSLFTHCTLPEGWRRAGTDHAMHSDILDERGVRRVGVFYKAAFYDRSANAHLVNVGWSLTTNVVYGDGPVRLPNEWSVLTEEERADFVQGLRDEANQRYGQDAYKLRAREALKLVES